MKSWSCAELSAFQWWFCLIRKMQHVYIPSSMANCTVLLARFSVFSLLLLGVSFSFACNRTLKGLYNRCAIHKIELECVAVYFVRIAHRPLNSLPLSYGSWITNKRMNFLRLISCFIIICAHKCSIQCNIIDSCFPNALWIHFSFFTFNYCKRKGKK